MWRLKPTPLLVEAGMRKFLGSIALVAVLVSVPALAEAQRRAATTGGAKHEFGVDLFAGYVKPDGVDGGIVIGTPVEIGRASCRERVLYRV